MFLEQPTSGTPTVKRLERPCRGGGRGGDKTKGPKPKYSKSTNSFLSSFQKLFMETLLIKSLNYGHCDIAIHTYQTAGTLLTLANASCHSQFLSHHMAYSSLC